MDILSDVKKYHWILNWSGNWPLLDCDFQLCDEFDEEARKLIGIPIVNLEIASTKEKTMTIYRAQEDFDELDRFFKEKRKADPQFLKKSSHGYQEKAEKDLRALREIRGIQNLAALSNEELIEIFREARSHFHYNAMIDIYDWYMERTFIPELEKHVRERLKKLGKEDQTVEYVNILLTPHEESVIYKERQKFFALVKYAQDHEDVQKRIRKGEAIKDILSSGREFEKLFQSYFQKYVWMPVLVNNPPQTVESVGKDIQEFIVNKKPFKIESKRLGDDFDPQIIAKARFCLEELKPPDEMRTLIEGLRAMAFLRTADYVVMSESSYCVIPLYTEIGKRLGVTYSEIKEFLSEEIIDFLRKNQKITPAQMRERANSCYMSMYGKRKLVVGKEAKKFQEFLESSLCDTSSTVKELEGIVASKGKVTGKVKIALSPKEAETITKGEILVVANVSAAFIPGLKRAGGIIAEFGGLTSHVVIVAREMHIPAIVGVKKATQVLRDGDMVELDAEKGIVKILS